MFYIMPIVVLLNSSEYFGNVVDLHSGAIDLMFPHHENEESQCCAFHGVDQWVNYWLHAGKSNFNSIYRIIIGNKNNFFPVHSLLNG